MKVTTLEVGGCQLIISIDQMHNVIVWDVQDRTLRRLSLVGETFAVGNMNGRPVIVSGDKEGTIRIWDLPTGEPRGAPLVQDKSKGSQSLVLGQLAGRSVIVSATRTTVSTTMKVWQIEDHSGRQATSVEVDHWVDAIAVAELDGRPVIVAGNSKGEVRVWELNSLLDDPTVRINVDLGSGVRQIAMASASRIVFATDMGLLVLRLAIK
jgi:WD40 repeat protein